MRSSTLPLCRKASRPARLAALLLCIGCATTPNDTGPDAIAQLEALVAARDHEELYQRANQHFDRGSYAEAIQHYEATLRVLPDHTNAMVNAGVCARRLGDVGGAIDWYDRALAQNPTDPITLQNRIVAGTLLDRFAESEKFAQRLCELEPDRAANWAQWGDLLFAINDFENAAIAFQHAADLIPTESDYHLRLGIAHIENANEPQALAGLLTALDLAPRQHRAYEPALRILLQQQDYDRAWIIVAQGQTYGVPLDAALLANLRERSGKVGPE